MNLIVNADANWGIGKNGELLFPIPQDLKYFKELTIGGTVIMGRKTLESFPGGRPLKNRENIVMTRDMEYKNDAVTVVHSIEEALEAARGKEKVFVIGGASVYEQMIPYCDTAYVTKVFSHKEADSHIMNFDLSPEWKLVHETKDFSHEAVLYRFCTYERNNS